MRQIVDRQVVLDAAMRLARRGVWAELHRSHVATEAGVSTGVVSNAFGGMDALREEVMRQAVTEELVDVLAQGLLTRSPAALAAPMPLKVRAVRVAAGA